MTEDLPLFNTLTESDTQKADVLRHIRQHGSITSLESFRLYGITRLSGVIYSLKHDGHSIDKEMIKVLTRRGAAHVAKYFLTNGGSR